MNANATAQAEFVTADGITIHPARIDRIRGEVVFVSGIFTVAELRAAAKHYLGDVELRFMSSRSGYDFYSRAGR